MLSQTSSIIYLAERRPCIQTTQYRSFRIFQPDGPAGAGWPDFGLLNRFDDDTLAGGCRQTGRTGSGSLLLLLPLLGDVVFSTRACEQVVEAGMLLAYPAESATGFVIVNPYPDGLVNYLLFSLQTAPSSPAWEPRRIAFDIDASRNSLHPLWSGPGAHVAIGKFGGRQEGRYTLQDGRNSLFAFVIAGVFEVQNRLLQDRDALSLQDVAEVEFEALSHEAILLVLEVFGVFSLQSSAGSPP